MNTRPSKLPRLKDCEDYWFSALQRRSLSLPRALSPVDVAMDGVRAWEDEITVLKSLIASARMQRNAFIRGCSLPPEVLRRIFTYVKYSAQYVPPTEEQSSAGYLKAASWLAITLVCRSWYDIAIDHRELWADLWTESKQPWNLFLHRARFFPLSVIATVSEFSMDNPIIMSAADTEYARLIDQHFYHIRDLDFTTLSAESLNSLVSNTSLKPDLRSLRLCLASLSKAPFVLPLSFFETAPALEAIRLDGCLFSWSQSIAPPNLRSLAVVYNERWTGAGDASAVLADYLLCDTAKILQFLQHTPRLEELSLGFLSSTSVLTSGIVDVVALPRLKTISLYGTSQACCEIWSSVHMHPDASINICTTTTLIPEAQTTEVLSFLSTHLASPNLPTFTTVDLQGDICGLFNEIVMKAMLPPDSDVIDAEGNGGGRQAIINLDLNSSLFTIAELCAKIPLYHIEELRMKNIRLSSVDDWFILLSAVPSVKKIVFAEMPDYSDSIQAFCSAVTLKGGDLHSQRGAVKASVLVPHLTHLKFENITFDGEIDEDADASAETVASCVVRMLAVRKDALCAPRVLTIESCSISKLTIESLTQAAMELEWDGKHETWSADDDLEDNSSNSSNSRGDISCDSDDSYDHYGLR